jgi:hypothetical protein
MESHLSLCPNQTRLLQKTILYVLGKNLKADTCDISTKELSFEEPRGKDVSSFEKVLVSAGNDWCGIL